MFRQGGRLKFKPSIAASLIYHLLKIRTPVYESFRPFQAGLTIKVHVCSFFFHFFFFFCQLLMMNYCYLQQMYVNISA